MKKSIPKVRERESEASILGNDREREFLLTPAFMVMFVTVPLVMSIVLSLVMLRRGCIVSRVGCIVSIMMIVMIIMMVMLVVFVVIIMIVMLTILVIITTIIFVVLVSFCFTVAMLFSVPVS